MPQKKDLQPGVKYRGYGLLNEYGEFEFIPEETGKNKGKRKMLKQGANYSVSLTRDSILVHINQSRSSYENKVQLMTQFIGTVNEILKIFREYEI